MNNKTVDEIIKNLSIKYRIPESSIKLIIDHTFSNIKASMADENLPSVLVHNFGRFKVNRRYLVHKIRAVFKYTQENDVRIEYYERLSKYLKAHKRICKEDDHEYSDEFIQIEQIVNKRLEDEESKK